MKIDEILLFLEKVNFKYAKSYASTFPHHYINRSDCDEKEFEGFLKYIRENSKIKKFYSKQYLCLEIGEYEYWEMGRPIKSVQVINRALINNDANYRIPQPSKDEEILLKAKLMERDIFLESLLEKDCKTEKDEKIISFLLNSTRSIHGGGKNIIDHSKLKIRYE